MRQAHMLLGLLAWTTAACTDGKGDDTGNTGVDADSDGFTVDDDCDDADAAINPDAAETCDGVDNNCDGSVDEGVLVTVYADGDGDGYGDAGAASEACGAGSGTVEDSTDCDDSNDAIHPDAAEDDCTDPTDYNCDGSVAYADADSDGWAACEDCNDTDDTISPDADEVCDAIDNDCDDVVDEDDAIDALTWYADADGDGYGDPGNAVTACAQPGSSYVADSTDCDDTADTIYPGAAEICDAADSDCSGSIAEPLVPTDYGSIAAAFLAGESWICVEPGTYTELVDFGGADVVLESAEGPDVTILDGTGDGPVVTFAAAETSAAVLRGFTVTGGYLGDGGTGAGIYISGASPTLEHLIIEDNEIVDSLGISEGAGLYAEDASVTLTDSILRDNHMIGGSFGGGGASLYLAEAIFDHVTFDGNTVVDETPWGGGLMINYSDVLILNSAFYANEVENATSNQLTGAAISTLGGTADLANVIFAGNVSTDTYGSGDNFGNTYFAYSDHAATLTNVTFTGNTTDAASYVYGSALTAFSATATLVNVDFTDNGATSTTATIYAGELSCFSGTITATYTNRYGLLGSSIGALDCLSTDLTNMLAVDPLYTDTSATDPASWDLTLGKGSPLIDAGDPAISDPDKTVSDVGAYGGPGAADW